MIVKDKSRFFREQIIILMILLLCFLQIKDIQCDICPASCNCTKNTIYDLDTTCKWEHSSINIKYTRLEYLDLYFKFHYDYTIVGLLLALNITCHGATPSCVNLPQINTDFSEVTIKLYLTSCDPNILGCMGHIFPNMLIIKNITLDDTKDLEPDTIIELSDTIPSYKHTGAISIKGGDWQLYPNMFKGMFAISAVFDSNGITKLPDDIFVGADYLQLIISNNELKHISKAAFRGLDHLKVLLLLENVKLKSVDPEFLSGKKYFTLLVLQGNALEFLPNCLLNGLDRLSKVIIIDNLVEIRLDSQAFANTSLVELKVSNSKLVNLPDDLFLQSYALETIDFGDNMIKRLPANLFRHTISLRDIILKNNRIQIVPKGIFLKSKNLRTVDLRNNNIVQMSGVIFAWDLVLDNLLLDHNNITELDLSTFETITVTNLSLSSNKIKKLSRGRFPRKIKANNINLSDNRIGAFENLPFDKLEVKKLNFSRNEISDVEEMELTFYFKTEIDLRYNNISDLMLNPQASVKPFLYLSNNPLVCNCDITKFLKSWKMYGRILDSEEITFDDGQRLSDVKLYIVCGDEDADNAIIGISAVGALVVVIIITSMIRARYKIWKYMTSICYRNASNITTTEIIMEDNKKYDLFISFAHQDSEFVTDELLPKLENDFGQKVCVHYRDWIVGELIPDQIIRSVDSSRMTMIILTEHFLESEWSYLEFRTAHKLGVQARQTKVIIIVLDETALANEKMTPELKSYIVINTYLLWSDSNFWKELQQKLPRQGGRTRGKRLRKI